MTALAAAATISSAAFFAPVLRAADLSSYRGIRLGIGPECGGEASGNENIRGQADPSTPRRDAGF